MVVSKISTGSPAPSPRQIKLRCVRTAGVGSSGMSLAHPSALLRRVVSVAFPLLSVASASPEVASVASAKPVELRQSRLVSVDTLLAGLSSVPRVPVASQAVASGTSAAALLAEKLRRVELAASPVEWPKSFVASASVASASVASASVECPRSILGKVFQRLAAERQENVVQRMHSRFGRPVSSVPVSGVSSPRSSSSACVGVGLRSRVEAGRRTVH